MTSLRAICKFRSESRRVAEYRSREGKKSKMEKRNGKSNVVRSSTVVGKELRALGLNTHLKFVYTNARRGIRESKARTWHVRYT